MSTLEDDRSSFGRGCDYRDDSRGGFYCRGGDDRGSSGDDGRRRIANNLLCHDGGGTLASRFVVGGFSVSRAVSRSRERSRNGKRLEEGGEEGLGEEARDGDCPWRGGRSGIIRRRYSGCRRSSVASSSAAASTTKEADLVPDTKALSICAHQSSPCSFLGSRTRNAHLVYSSLSPGHPRRRERRTGRRRARRGWIGIATAASVVLLAMTATPTAAVADLHLLLPRVHHRVANAGSKAAAAVHSNRRCCFLRQPSHRVPIVGAARVALDSHRMRHCGLSPPRHPRLSSSSTRTSAHAIAPNGEGDGGRGATTSDGATSNTILAAKRQQLHSSARLSLAPMMDYTDRHFRYLMRLITSRTLLYSEMVAANALAHERRDRLDFEAGEGKEHGRRYDDFYLRRFLAQSSLAPGEGTSVLQLGGSDPRQMYESARAVLEASSLSSHNLNSEGSGGAGPPYTAEYTALNLNCGCPSPKVANKGCFGAALMHDPHLVKELCSSMSEGADGTHPVTVKCRIGTDSTPDDDDQLYSGLCRFVDTVASGGVVTDFQVHARIAILTKKISPAKNRSVPPLKYHLVRRLAAEFPELTFTLNGGVDNLIMAGEELNGCGGPGTLSGVMVGRGMAAAPWNWATADEYLFGDGAPNVVDHLPRDRWGLLEAYGAHADSEEATYGTKVRRFILRALQSVFAGEPNAKRFRVALDEIGGLPKREEEARRRQRRQLGKDGGGDGDDSFAASTGTPLSELILRAARDCFSDEVLHRTREESFEIMRLGVEKEESRRKMSAASLSVGGTGRGVDDGVVNGGEGSRSAVVREWQTRRKEEEADATIDAANGNQEDAGEGSGSGDGTKHWVHSS